MNQAARGSRNLDDGVEKIEDKDEVRDLRRQALKVHGESILAAASLTMFFVAIPI